MRADEFKAWRTKLSLTQKAAAKELGVATLTVQKYERGFRNDTQQPVIIPDKIALACEEVSRRLHQKESTTKLKWKQVSADIIERIGDKMCGAGLGFIPHPVTCFHHDNYQPFSSEIESWLEANISHGYAKVCVPDQAAIGETVIVLHFFDQNDAMSFALTFGGRALTP
ncbi:helix-turn-helix transcriptional regulator [Methylobacterium sp. WCS2018Hpa-22]|uniref:helix-turn-helix domain-containing protein n=1 Tax=Methylobacterium sp. WCS2018Hpa-22 TaxID=3073633 RepID=UPI00288B1C48|nr:helix-turn-helix transcriptional regulator [Methylobacterium sp. WCS2018Hpa-22]